MTSSWLGEPCGLSLSRVGDRHNDADDVRMGFEISKGKYVTFDKDELAQLRPASTKVLEVADFVTLDEIDPVYYERTYWLAPDGDAARKAYALLVAAMEDRRLVAIGAVVMRNKQYLAAIRPMAGALAMSTMRFADEVLDRREIEELAGRKAKPDERALAMAVTLIDSMHVPWKPEQYHDTYVEELRRRIKAKQTGKTLDEPEVSRPTGNVVDLMAALEQSVTAAKARRAAPKAARSRAERSTAKPRGSKASGQRASSEEVSRRSA